MKQKQQQNSKEQTTEIQTTQETHHRHRHRHQTGINWWKNIPYLLIAVLLGTAFFAHESVIFENYDSINKANSKYRSALSIMEKKRDSLIETLKGSDIYIEYKTAQNDATRAYEPVRIAYEEIKFYEFNSLQQFVGEFGWALAVFIYSLINLIITFFKKDETILGKTFLHATILCISIFFIRWCFTHEDFSKATYIVVNVLSTTFLIISCYIYVAYKEKRINDLKVIVHDALGVIFDYLPFISTDKKPEMEIDAGKLVKQVKDYGK